jgi:hypothetical protein
MMVSPYNFTQFITSLQGLNYLAVIDEAEREANRVEDGSHHVKGARRAREMGCLEYVRMLEALLLFMRHGQRPNDISDETFALLRPVCVSLVGTGQFTPGILDLFH